jgi:hypothetical protein
MKACNHAASWTRAKPESAAIMRPKQGTGMHLAARLLLFLPASPR